MDPLLQIKHMRKKGDHEPPQGQIEAERAAAEETCRVFKGFGPEPMDLVISSFSVYSLEVCKERLPSVCRSLLVERRPVDWQQHVRVPLSCCHLI